MNITELTIDGFGVWTGLRLEEVDPDVTVIYGPNEAGKTTLLEFARSMLYGFSPARRQRYLPPLRGGAPGGSLGLSTSRGSYLLHRHAGPTFPAVEGEVRLINAEGKPQSPLLLRGLLSDVDESVYQTVFAFGLQEIQELGTLGDTAAAELLYKLSTGLDQISLFDVLRELNASRQRLLAADEKPSQILQLQAERERLRGEIEQLRDGARQYARLHSERELRDAEMQRVEAEHTELGQRARLLDVAAMVREKWRERMAVDAQLAALGEVRAVPPKSLEQIDEANTEITRRRPRLAAHRIEHKVLREEATALALNEPLWKQAPRIQALVEQQGWHASLEKDIQGHEQELAQLEAQLATEYEELGLKGRNATETGKNVDSNEAWKKLLPTARSLRKAQHRAEHAEQQSKAARESAEVLAKDIRTALESRDETELQPALERAGAVVANLRRRAQLDERMDQMGRHRAELADQCRGLMDRQLLPMWVVTSLGGMFVVGVVLVLAWMFLPTSFVGTAGGTLAAVGLIGTAASMGAKFFIERSGTRQLEICQGQIGRLDSQLKDLKDERAAIDERLPRGGGPILARLQTAEKDLSQLEELLGVESRRQQALNEAESRRALAARAAEEVKSRRNRWQQALIAAGLPPGLSPGHVKKYSTRREQLAELQGRIQRRRQDLGERRKELDGLLARITQLLTDVQLKPTGGRPTEQLRRLQAELAEQEKIVARRGQLRERGREIRKVYAQEVRELRDWIKRREQILRAAGVKNEDDLRRRAAQGARAEKLREQRAGLTRDIVAALGPTLKEEQLREHLDRVEPNHLEGLSAEIAVRRQTAGRKLQELAEKRGQLSQQMQTLAADRRMSQRMLELSAVDERLAEAIEQWQTLAVTHRMLESIRKNYEAERQPETLIEASTFLSRLTEGAYTRVWTPLDDDVLYVDDAEGRAISVELLSRGTREQLFLSLRLALVSLYGRKGACLPLVLDDVFVNFDEQRTKAAAKVIREFAAGGRQVLFITCHEHIARLFMKLGVRAYRLPDNTVGGPATLIEDERPAVKVAPPVVFAPVVPEPKPAPPPPPRRPETVAVDALLMPAPAPRRPKFVAVDALLMPDPPPVSNGHIEEPPKPKKRPAPEPPPPPAVKHRPVKRIRRKSPIFANAVWHEPIEDEFEELATEAWAEPEETLILPVDRDDDDDFAPWHDFRST